MRSREVVDRPAECRHLGDADDLESSRDGGRGFDDESEALLAEPPRGSEENVQCRAVDERHTRQIEHQGRAVREDHGLQALPELLHIGEIEVSRDSQDDDLQTVRVALLELELGHVFRRYDLEGIVKS